MDQLIYKGFVNLKYKIGNKTYEINQHNDGTNDLFKAFAMMLAGDSNCLNYTPYYLDINTGTKTLKYKVNATGKTVNTSNQCVMTFSVPSDALQESIPSATSKLMLYATDGTIKLAELEADLHTFTQGSGLNLIVQWTMCVVNA